MRCHDARERDWISVSATMNRLHLCLQKARYFAKSFDTRQSRDPDSLPATVPRVVQSLSAQSGICSDSRVSADVDKARVLGKIF